MEQNIEAGLDGENANEEKRREAILHINNGVEALRVIAEEHNIDFLGYVLRLAKLETELLLSPDEDELDV